jgi:hypothetical protein
MSFEALKKNRKAAFNSLLDRAKAAEGKQNFKDDRYWKPTPDKSGSGQAIIRFLPPPDGEEVEWVQYYDHGFKGPSGRWYIEKSLTSIGEPDPVGEMNSKIWSEAERTGDESKKNLVRSRKRRRHFVSNIYVVSDPAAPENNGKVFLYRYGKRIFDKIKQAMEPEFDDETPINPFDFWEGANFKLRFRVVDGQRNYDLSTFTETSPLLDGDEEKLKEVYESLHSLTEIVDRSQFKSYDELRKHLMRVLGEDDLTTKQQIELSETAEPVSEKSVDSDVVVESTVNTASTDEDEDEEDEDDDALGFYQRLAAED